MSSGNWKYTEDLVMEIRKVYSTGDYSLADLSKLFNINRGTIHKLTNGQRWGHLPLIPMEKPFVRSGRKTVHGDSLRSSTHSYLYRTWDGMKERCYKVDSVKYKWWGGRGIRIYRPWINDYPKFKEWILENLGERPEGRYSLDRKNNDGNYEPGNLRWADDITQNRNQRRK